MPLDSGARRRLLCASLALVVGPALVALGLGVGEHLVWPILQAIAGAPDPTYETLSLAAQRIAYASAGTLLAAVLPGLVLARRRGHGSWIFNPASLAVGWIAYGWLSSLAGIAPDLDRWGLLPMLAQLALVSTAYPWVVDRTELPDAMRRLARAALALPLGAGLIALGLGASEHVCAPAIRALFGPPFEQSCTNTWSQGAYWFAEVTAATAAIAAAAGALFPARPRDARLCFNALAMILGYWSYAVIFETREYTPAFKYWDLWNSLAQLALVYTLYRWLFDRAAAWRAGRGDRERPGVGYREPIPGRADE